VLDALFTAQKKPIAPLILVSGVQIRPIFAFWRAPAATFCGFIATQSIKGCRSRTEFAVFNQQNSCASALCRSSKLIRTKERKGTGHGQSSHQNEDCSEEEDGGEEAGREEARCQARLIATRFKRSDAAGPGRAPGQRGGSRSVTIRLMILRPETVPAYLSGFCLFSEPSQSDRG